MPANHRIKKHSPVGLRIMHVVSSLMAGGMEQFVIRLATEQQSRGHRVFVLALRPGPLAEQAPGAFKCRVLDCRSTPMRAAAGALTMALHRPQIIHAHNETSLQYAALGKLITGAAVVMTDHGTPQDDVRSATPRERSSTDAVVAVAAASAATLDDRWSPKAVYVIRNGVGPHSPSIARNQMRESLGATDGTVVGIMTARIDGRKGHDYLLNGLASLNGRPILMLLVGDGAEKAAMTALASNLGILEPARRGSCSVRFLGYRADVANLLGAADFFALPSLSEGLPMSILEAMAAGLPIVATSVGGVEEIVFHRRTGLVVPPCDASALASAIDEIVQSAAMRRRFGLAGRTRATEELSFDSMADRYTELYYDVLNGRSGIHPCDTNDEKWALRPRCSSASVEDL